MFKRKIKQKDIIAFILCFSFIPVYAFQLVIGSNGYLVLQIISILYISVKVIEEGKILNYRLFICFFVLMIWMAICSAINSLTVWNSFYYVGRVAFWFLVNAWYLTNGSLRLLRICRKYVTALAVITLIQQLVAPGVFGYVQGSLNARNFFISDNYLGYYLISLIALCFVLDFIEYDKIQYNTYLVMGICIASIVQAWAVKNVIGVFLVVFYVLFIYKKKVARFFGPRLLIFGFSIFLIGMVFFNMHAIFYNIASNVFGKGQSFSVRFYVWEQALRNIQASPIIGYGIPDGARLQLQYNYAGHARSSHNLFIEIVLEGGIVGLCLYIIPIIVCLVNNERKYKGKNRYEFLFLLFEVFVFFSMEMFSGSIYFPFYYMPVILINNFEELLIIKEKRHEKTNLYSHKL